MHFKKKQTCNVTISLLKEKKPFVLPLNSRYLFTEIALKIFSKCKSGVKYMKYEKGGLLNKIEYIKTAA